MQNVRTQLKEHLVPELRNLGFKGSFPHFRRIHEQRIHLLTFQFDKYGTGRFVIELAVAPRGPFTTSWGKEIAEGKLTAHDLNERQRLCAKEGGDHWFSVEPHIIETVDEILELLQTKGQKFLDSKN